MNPGGLPRVRSSGRRIAARTTLLVAVACLAACSLSTDPIEPEEMPSTEIHGYLQLRSQAEVDALLGVRTIVGDLRVSGKDITDLSGLRTLQRVEGRLDLDLLPGLASLRGLRTLRSVETLRIRYCHGITDLNELAGLERCTWLQIDTCARLRRLLPTPAMRTLEIVQLSSLDSLTTVADLAGALGLTTVNIYRLPRATGYEAFAGLPQLKTLVLEEIRLPGALDLRRLSRLEMLSLDDLHGVRTIGASAGMPALETLRIADCDSLTAWGPWGELPVLRTLAINGLPALADLGGIGACPNLRALRVSGCGSLEDLAGLPATPALEDLEVRNCYEMTSLRGLSAAALTSLRLNYLPELTELALPPAAMALEEFASESCWDLTTLDGLELAEGADVFLYGARDLHRLDDAVWPTHLARLELSVIGCQDLRGLTDVATIGELMLRRCDLRSLSGLENLTGVGDRIEMSDNRSLSDVTALRNVASVGEGGVEIRRQRRLDQCAVERLVGRWRVAGPALIRDNGPCAGTVD